MRRALASLAAGKSTAPKRKRGALRQSRPIRLEGDVSRTATSDGVNASSRLCAPANWRPDIIQTEVDMPSEAFWKFDQATDETLFLFDESMAEYIQTLKTRGTALRRANLFAQMKRIVARRCAKRC
jgi:hypothetical protein